jgi:thiol:disulfide interchange protein DsbD
MLDFYADWCITCKELEKFTFSDAGVQAALSSAVLLQADVTPYDAQDQALLRRYGLIGPPAVLFFGPDGVERRPYRLVGFLNAPDFRAHAQQALR